MSTPKYRQGEVVGLCGCAVFGKIVKVTKVATGYQYRLRHIAINGTVYFGTYTESELFLRSK